MAGSLPKACPTNYDPTHIAELSGSHANNDSRRDVSASRKRFTPILEDCEKSG